MSRKEWRNITVIILQFYQTKILRYFSISSLSISDRENLGVLNFIQIFFFFLIILIRHIGAIVWNFWIMNSNLLSVMSGISSHVLNFIQVYVQI